MHLAYPFSGRFPEVWPRKRKLRLPSIPDIPVTDRGGYPIRRSGTHPAQSQRLLTAHSALPPVDTPIGPRQKAVWIGMDRVLAIARV